MFEWSDGKFWHPLMPSLVEWCLDNLIPVREMKDGKLVQSDLIDQLEKEREAAQRRSAESWKNRGKKKEQKDGISQEISPSEFRQNTRLHRDSSHP
jgi:hypothetical protein